MDPQHPLLVRGPSNAWQHVRSQSVDCLDIPDDGVEVRGSGGRLIGRV